MLLVIVFGLYMCVFDYCGLLVGWVVGIVCGMWMVILLKLVSLIFMIYLFGFVIFGYVVVWLLVVNLVVLVVVSVLVWVMGMVYVEDCMWLEDYFDVVEG